MQQLIFEEAGRYAWREAPDPEISRRRAGAGSAADGGLLRSRRRRRRGTCCRCRPGHAVGHEGLAEVVAVGDAGHAMCAWATASIVPFQINCGQCNACRRGVTGSCASLPLMAMYGMAPLAGLDGGGFMADLVLVPYADAMLLPVPAGVDPVAIASLVGQHPRRLARDRSVPRRTGRPRRGRPPHARGR